MGPFEGRFGHGPWEGNPRFGEMGAFATRLKGLGVRPGIWFRPLTPLADSPDAMTEFAWIGDSGAWPFSD